MTALILLRRYTLPGRAWLAFPSHSLTLFHHSSIGSFTPGAGAMCRGSSPRETIKQMTAITQTSSATARITGHGEVGKFSLVKVVSFSSSRSSIVMKNYPK